MGEHGPARNLGSSDVIAALDVLGLTSGVSFERVRATYRSKLRTEHPDIAGAYPSSHSRTAQLIEAYQVLVAHVNRFDVDVVEVSENADLDTWAVEWPPMMHKGDANKAPAFGLIDAQALDEDTIAISAPPPETYVALYEAAGRVGDISYYDRQLGILETIVRFEGGPSCSLLMTLQGRAHHTEVFCTLESIEAAPTPAIRPVIESLVRELESL